MHTNSPTSEVRMHAARQFIGYAVKHNPVQLYHAMDAPYPADLGHTAQQHLTAKGYNDGKLLYVTSPEEDVGALLRNAVDDTRRILQPIFDESHPMSESRALRIAMHPGTILSFAKIALREEGDEEQELQGLIDIRVSEHSKENQTYHLDSSATYITTNSELLSQPQDGGCPFAGKNGEIDIDPLFKRFIPWAGELVLRSLYTHEYNNTLDTHHTIS